MAYIPPERMRRIRDLSLEIERLRNQATALQTDINRLDQMFQYLTRDRNRGVTRDALNALRLANGPMGMRDITLRVMAAQGMDTADGKAVNRLMEKLRVSLTRQWRAGVVRREPGPGWSMVWSVVG